MAQQLLSASWYRVASLQPRLRSHARIHRHQYRGERWYVLTDRISRRAHRFSPAAYTVIGLMNGERTMEGIWDAAVARFGDDAPTQDEMIQLFGQLHAADVLQCEVTPDVDELLRRTQRLGRQGRLQKLLSPLAVRIPLFDPDRLLERTLAWYRPLFGPFGALLWLAVVAWGAALAAQHWDALAQDLGHRVLAPGNLVLLALVFPVLKALHEFGHACAVKAWGGEVHEMGIMLLVLMPVPYMDASAASAFPEKRRRVLVGAAGMVVEVFIAALALAFWVEMEPGAMRAVLFNVMLIAGVSTLLFNANPLLRFDGYYILADLIEIPNLRQRANRLLAGLAQRWLFGMPVAVPDASAAERAWLVLFAIAAFCYRLFITLAIALFVGAQYFIFGVLLALWALIQAFVVPLVGLGSYLAFSPRLGRSRPRAVLASALLGALLVATLGFAPFPSWTNAQGVVALPEQTVVRAGSEGFVQRVLARPGEAVRRGEPLIELADPLLEARLRVLRAQIDELQARYQLERIDRLVRAQITQDQMKSAAADLARARERLDELVMRSPADGVFALAAAQDLPGRFLKPGEPVGHVVAGGGMTVRAIVPQQAVDLVREHTERVELQLAERIGEVYASRIVREVPRAVDRLPSQALSQMGGGEVALDPSAPGDARTLQSHFEFELALPPGRPVLLGGRVYVRFEHVPEPLAAQLWRWLQQLFLRRLAV